MPKVLVIGDDVRSFLAVVRALGRIGAEVHAAPFDFTSPALASSYIHALHRLPPYGMGAQAWCEALCALVDAEGLELIIPCDDRSVLPLDKFRTQIPTRLALPNTHAVCVFFDKSDTRALAEACGVPVANGGPVDIDTATRLGFPLALKPRASLTLDSLDQRAAVRIIPDAATLDVALHDLDPADEYFLEAFFAGEGVGVSVLAEHGEIRAAFQHRRLAETSQTGGSARRVGEVIDQKLFGDVARMVAATRLHGVAMFEFRQNPQTHTHVLLEVNCRFWGSLPLAIASGVDFPALLFHMLMDEPGGAAPELTPGIQRTHLSGEYYRRRAWCDGASSRLGIVMRAAAALPPLFMRALFNPQQFDSYARDDMMPWRYERRTIIQGLAMAVRKRLPVNAAALAKATKLHVQSLLRAAPPTPHLLFVCYGNICRSPFAEVRARDVLGARAHCTSAGTLPWPGRRSPDDALQVAAEFNVDLYPHRSAYCDDARAAAADIIFIFDDHNAEQLAQMGIDSAKIVRLGGLIGAREIADPYGLGARAFQHCYIDIAKAIDTLSALLEPR
ncbi:MAG: ATP-grasp domain-containing protein [Alphaproteobacteria bacterium]|nr:ATP-grasp domain-containing protein [Alphaproteobacteria bacterium]MDE2041824.1 ATP-grasp domain-containing protein [Alphaproteobacteria bacterium]MDE2339814.1 ATP-grasp domain-containing protein [Alphaproteobacteria bacterium]